MTRCGTEPDTESDDRRYVTVDGRRVGAPWKGKWALHVARWLHEGALDSIQALPRRLPPPTVTVDYEVPEAKPDPEGAEMALRIRDAIARGETPEVE